MPNHHQNESWHMANWTHFNEISFQSQTFSFKKTGWKTPSFYFRLFCSGLNVVILVRTNQDTFDLDEYSDVTLLLWHIKTSTTLLFVQQPDQLNGKENTNALHCWPFLKANLRWLVVPLTKASNARNVLISQRHQGSVESDSTVGALLCRNIFELQTWIIPRMYVVLILGSLYFMHNTEYGFQHIEARRRV